MLEAQRFDPGFRSHCLDVALTASKVGAQACMHLSILDSKTWSIMKGLEG